MVKERSKQLYRRTEKTISYDGALCCLKVNEPLLSFVKRRRLQLDTTITHGKPTRTSATRIQADLFLRAHIRGDFNFSRRDSLDRCMLEIVNFAHCRPGLSLNRVATSLFIHHLKNSSYTNIIHGASLKVIELISLNHLLASALSLFV